MIVISSTLFGSTTATTSPRPMPISMSALDIRRTSAANVALSSSRPPSARHRPPGCEAARSSGKGEVHHHVVLLLQQDIGAHSRPAATDGSAWLVKQHAQALDITDAHDLRRNIRRTPRGHTIPQLTVADRLLGMLDRQPIQVTALTPPSWMLGRRTAISPSRANGETSLRRSQLQKTAWVKPARRSIARERAHVLVGRGDQPGAVRSSPLMLRAARVPWPSA